MESTLAPNSSEVQQSIETLKEDIITVTSLLDALIITNDITTPGIPLSSVFYQIDTAAKEQDLQTKFLNEVVRSMGSPDLQKQAGLANDTIENQMHGGRTIANGFFSRMKQIADEITQDASKINIAADLAANRYETLSKGTRDPSDNIQEINFYSQISRHS